MKILQQEKLVRHRFRVHQACIFTNRGTSGVTSNDGKRCLIIRLKPPESWRQQKEPEYVINFIDENHGFGVRESELEPIKERRKK